VPQVKKLMKALNTALPSLALAGVLGLSMQTTDAATIVDLATAANGSGTIGGAQFVWIDSNNAGTGLIDSFVQISGSGNLDQTHAYNTTVNNVLNNGSADNFNHSITLSQVPRINLNGVLYREFMLDINENNNAAGDQYLSLDEVQLFLGGTANASFNTFTGGILDHDGTLIYDMEGALNNWVALNFAFNAGSGTGDMFLYLPNAWFAGYGDSAVVTLYSHFGRQGVDPVGFTGNFHTSDGFEEWAVRVGVDFCAQNPGDRLCNETQVPEPGTLALLGLGLAGLGLSRRRRLAA